MVGELINGNAGAVKDVVICVIGTVISIYIPSYFKKREKKDEQMWERINKHGHSIDCQSKECKPKTTAVTISPEEH